MCTTCNNTGIKKRTKYQDILCSCIHSVPLSDIFIHWWEDPGHGWLKVPLHHLETLGIKQDISSFSYKDSNNAYLEEDRDAGIYFRTREKLGIPLDHRSIPTIHKSPRNYDRI